MNAEGESRHERIEALAERAHEERERFVPPENPDERALSYLTDGLWPVLELYIGARSSGEGFSRAEHAALEDALNEWLELYALCYGAGIDAAFSVRETAELFVETHSVRDTAQLLTHVPTRR
ncbi:hypothetical protein [Halalkalicoccus jeotgali]|uniref:DUF8055 domain-containing protein n=1 Tax=Halalkalicoccus jeotgali (strain DSM 18796 / CECT 7217 / JCM 14584 / KCTC 4019 / B3) TaxID=795797 RepID=D8J6B6_HALJB|nr:hypothetical protein [Halalkalicoccus jeotgali]ADJ15834.1 hypothetical protein HacjB3_12255 [Halalkalicoccus jeotgali B3]ELY38264.1 hypothetical protein C497_07444 [Halalkalicoccus jeotgali B3]